jgi:hypothetical protein
MSCANTRASFTAVAFALSLGGSAFAQSSLSIDFAGASISSLSTSPPDLVRTSMATIDASPGYLTAFNPVVRGTGFLGLVVIPTDTPLGDVLNGFVPGQQRILYSAVRNPGAGVPVQLSRETLAGTFSGLNLSLTFTQSVLANRTGQSGVRNITKPFGLGLNIVSGGAVYQTWTPPAPRTTEFHFDGDLLSVLESGLAPTSGPGKLRYLDDPRHGPILGGPGQENVYPNPPTPTDITRQQSAFGTTTSFGIPNIGTEVDTVYRVSPPRNLADPTNRAKSRGIGLAFWPNTRDHWPEDRHGQWTMIWDILIPNFNSEFAAVLIEDNHNNDSSGDAFIRIRNGQATFGYQSDFATYTNLNVQPNTWFRLALSSDGYRTNTGRIFVNGQFLGTTQGDWIYNACKSTDPRFGDVSSTNPTGTAVPAATWDSWGRFPSPWAQAPNATLAPMASTVCLFSDLQGRGEVFYVANFFFTDEAMTDAQIQALGGPNARGIVHLRPAAPTCVADVDDGTGTGTPDGGVTIDDLLYYLGTFEAGVIEADVDDGTGTGTPDGGVTIDDLLYYLLRFEAGC